MGIVCFQSRQDGRKLLENMLLDQHNDEYLSSFLRGETVVLSLHLSEEQFGRLTDEELPGVRAREGVSTPSNVNPGYEVDLDFQVTDRIHHIFPDWTNDQNGFRLSGTTIYLRPASNQAEALFIQLIG